MPPLTHVHLVIVIDNAADQYALKAHLLKRSFLMLDTLNCSHKKKLSILTTLFVLRI